MYHFLNTLDRRWIFLLMGAAVTIPILLELQFPEEATSLAHAVFNESEQLEEGDPVLLAFDYDPASEGELGPMATAFVRHCCEKKLKIYFIALWPVGPQMIDDSINRVIKTDFPDMVYGEDYVNLGFKPGNEGVIKVIVTDLKQLYTTDDRGTNLDQIPMCRDLVNIQSMDLVAEVSAGYPGVKEWVQYAATPFPDQIRLVAGCTGVGAPLLYPYIPEQLKGLLGAIKGAAEYEKLVVDRYDREAGREPDLKYLEGKRRMGPQLVAHILMVVLIVVGNIVFFVGRAREGTNA